MLRALGFAFMAGLGEESLRACRFLSNGLLALLGSATSSSSGVTEELVLLKERIMMHLHQSYPSPPKYFSLYPPVLPLKPCFKKGRIALEPFRRLPPSFKKFLLSFYTSYFLFVDPALATFSVEAIVKRDARPSLTVLTPFLPASFYWHAYQGFINLNQGVESEKN